jgi:site-specific recombinase XerD
MSSRRNHRLDAAIQEYLLWLIDQNYSSSTWSGYQRLLARFSVFVEQQAIGWEQIFTLQTVESFANHCRDRRLYTVVRGLARYLHSQGKIPRPLTDLSDRLPEVYEGYLRHFAATRPASHSKLPGIRRLLGELHTHLSREDTALSAVSIEQIDGVLAANTAGLQPDTRQIRRSWLRGFLRYLYQIEVLPKDLAKLVIGARQYSDAKPPKFLRPEEIRRLFAVCNPVTPRELRTQAILHLAYFLGLRPKEVSLVSLDDLHFQAGEISLPSRKCASPMRLPLPENAIKTIAAYILGGRPKSTERSLFLTLRTPCRPIQATTVSNDLQTLMKKAGLTGSAYWLRHSYAQNLLETGSSIFEIKEMMGHDLIQTTRRYLHIHTRLMREVLFDETL